MTLILRGLRASTEPGAVQSTTALGAVYGLAGFCSGPVLGAVLTVAATRDSPVAGGVLLAAYALGMALPLFVLALVWDRWQLGRRGWVRGRELTLGPVRVHTTGALAGVLFVAVGALFLLFDGTAGVVGVLGVGDADDLEVRAQAAVTRWLSDVPAWPVAAAVALAAAVVAWRSRRQGTGAS